jgi:hypothetical protein
MVVAGMKLFEVPLSGSRSLPDFAMRMPRTMQLDSCTPTRLSTRMDSNDLSERHSKGPT